MQDNSRCSLSMLPRSSSRLGMGSMLRCLSRPCTLLQRTPGTRALRRCDLHHKHMHPMRKHPSYLAPWWNLADMLHSSVSLGWLYTSRLHRACTRRHRVPCIPHRTRRQPAPSLLRPHGRKSSDTTRTTMPRAGLGTFPPRSRCKQSRLSLSRQTNTCPRRT